MERRELMRMGALAACGGAIGFGVGRLSKEPPSRFYGGAIRGTGEAQERVWHRMKFIGQPVMDAQVLFLLGLAGERLTDIGETLDTAMRIEPTDERGWFREWIATADRVREYGHDAQRRGHAQSAGAHYLRAGAYYRAGLLRYPDHADPAMEQACHDALACHERALKLLGYNSRAVSIPYERVALRGRLYLSHLADVAPVIIMHQGLHAWPEDTLWVVEAALSRGYHALTFHGPGQCASLRLDGLPFRPDWERPVRAVVDFACQERRIDAEAIVLMGLSFGGALAPRAAAFEPRLRALVANPGVLNWGAAQFRHFDDFPGFIGLLDRSPVAFDQAVAGVRSVWPDADWWFEDAAWKHGVEKPHELMQELRRYDNTDVVGRIECPTLVMEGTAEDATPGQGRAFFDALRCPKTWLEFDDSTAAQTHCQGGGAALAQAWLFDWLDEQVPRPGARVGSGG